MNHKDLISTLKLHLFIIGYRVVLLNCFFYHRSYVCFSSSSFVFTIFSCIFKFFSLSSDNFSACLYISIGSYVFFVLILQELSNWISTFQRLMQMQHRQQRNINSDRDSWDIAVVKVKKVWIILGVIFNVVHFSVFRNHCKSKEMTQEEDKSSAFEECEYSKWNFLCY